ncbi:hypothetical protein pb186bvf_002136 [Paramecium bursaria]
MDIKKIRSKIYVNSNYGQNQGSLGQQNPLRSKRYSCEIPTITKNYTSLQLR